MKKIFGLLAAAALVVSLSSCSKQKEAVQQGPKPVTMGFISNAIADFWIIARAGTRDAAKDFGATCYYQMPSASTATEQKRIVEDMLSRGIDGLAISPIDPKNQTALLNDVASKAKLICEDSDAPNSKRLCYIGTNNIEAGHEAGKALLKALPNGGKVMVFVGTLDARNAAERNQGVKEAVKGSKIQILDTLTDGTDRVKAKANAEDTLIKYPDLAGFVGLWAYNGPACAEAVKAAKKVGKVKIIAFDEEVSTLQGIKDGVIDATVAQNPYQIGYQSVRVLAALVRGEDPKLPADKKIDTGVTLVTKTNVDQFWSKLRQLKERGN